MEIYYGETLKSNSENIFERQTKTWKNKTDISVMSLTMQGFHFSFSYGMLFLDFTKNEVLH